MEQIQYSVIIRTIGKAGEKYQNLLDSIARLTAQNEELASIITEEENMEIVGVDCVLFCAVCCSCNNFSPRCLESHWMFIRLGFESSREIVDACKLLYHLKKN